MIHPGLPHLAALFTVEAKNLRHRAQPRDLRSRMLTELHKAHAPTARPFFNSRGDRLVAGVAARNLGDGAGNSWFTGSLDAPSPALSKAGGVTVEPYFVYTANTGGYADD